MKKKLDPWTVSVRDLYYIKDDTPLDVISVCRDGVVVIGRNSDIDYIERSIVQNNGDRLYGEFEGSPDWMDNLRDECMEWEQRTSYSQRLGEYYSEAYSFSRFEIESLVGFCRKHELSYWIRTLEKDRNRILITVKKT
ncbi:hypothetical protein AMET1_1146 [Methanonatronarchaeum thermophilum]|uniref:Uncharacterized protein n=1 Tax=Methanonatronarchaeum thermophilum TaxID=1927129 RepID=A0A1Y3GAH0_9EURY|nr:hypothetical protein [Methanonatronarchaeum thermophilum]OUJ18240.1 hypothetical protein AMET1_1146 [Methanonatronarchaeum thermophilum]